MKHKKHLWNENSRYKSWVRKRDRALEKLHQRAQLEAADVMRDLLTHILLTTKAQHFGMSQGHTMSIEWFEHGLKNKFSHAASEFYRIITQLRSRAYTLARSSEGEILAQLQPGKQLINSVARSTIHEHMHQESMAGGNLMHRINLYCDRLRRRITSYAQAAAMTAKTPEEFAKDVMVAFPRARKVRVPRRTLKPQLMEAVRPDFSQSIGSDEQAADVAIDNIDEQAWSDMLDAYMTDYVPKSRAPEYVIGEPEVTGQDTWYAWEFERDITNEFVQSVRDGQIDAANEAGIADFVWIAVIDDKTDNCCAWRDGLLVSEIEAQLAEHADEDAECDVGDGEGLTPPIHFNCRCTLAPATDNIPEKPDDGAKDFEDWLNS